MWKTQLLFLYVIVKVSVVLLQFPVLKSFSIRSGNYVLAWISTYTAFLDCSLQDWALSSSVWHLFTFFPADWNVGWLAFNIHAEVAAFCDALRVANVIGLTNVQVITPCVMPCAAVLGYFFFCVCHWIKLSTSFLSLFSALSRVPDPLRQLRMKRSSAQWQSTPLTWERRSRSWTNYGGTLLGILSGLVGSCWVKQAPGRCDK